VEDPVIERAPDTDEGIREYRATATLVGGITAVALFLALRPSPPVIARPATSPAPVVSASTRIVVHVAGAVRSPGVYELAPGARVADAIEAAGGARPRADLNLLNLAEVVRDGMQILVGARGTAAAPAAQPVSSPGAPIVDLNAADQAALETIPGIGPVKAAAILGHRSEIGAFTSFDELLEVTGIGPATLESIRPYIAI
jgi:competence protein ComEA